jgi:hypothetical protein
VPRRRPVPDLHAAVIGYLTTRSWPYEDHGDGVVADVATDTGSWTVVFDIRDKQQQLIVYSIVPVEVPTHQRTEVALYLTRANFGLAIATFELDLDDGTVRCRTGVDLEGAEVCDPIVDHLLLANIMGVEQYLDGLRAVIQGDDPVAAIERTERASISSASGNNA